MKVLSRAIAKKKAKRLTDVKFRTLIGCFQVTIRQTKGWRDLHFSAHVLALQLLPPFLYATMYLNFYPCSYFPFSICNYVIYLNFYPCSYFPFSICNYVIYLNFYPCSYFPFSICNYVIYLNFYPCSYFPFSMCNYVTYIYYQVSVKAVAEGMLHGAKEAHSHSDTSHQTTESRYNNSDHNKKIH